MRRSSVVGVEGVVVEASSTTTINQTSLRSSGNRSGVALRTHMNDTRLHIWTREALSMHIVVAELASAIFPLASAIASLASAIFPLASAIASPGAKNEPHLNMDENLLI
ncbi:MAG: hypothetical protein ACJ8BW_05410 [Ktedonobacteraceae bacterium]